MDITKSSKLKLSTIIYLSLSWVFLSVATPLILALIEDSNAFSILKLNKPIDSLISIFTMPALLFPKLSIPVFVLSLLIASVLLNIFLFRRNILYLKGSKSFAELFYKTALKLSKLQKTPVKVVINNKDLIIDYEEVLGKTRR